jgi:RNA polymerase sigma factor (sigma-70 family)
MITTPEAMGAMDDERIAELFRQQRASLVTLAGVMTGSTQIAEELVQDAFLNLQQQIGPITYPEAYLRTAVVNSCRSYYRRRGVERRHAPGQRQRLVLEDPELDETWALVCALPVRQRAVLALRFYQDLSEAQIAETLGCRIGTVKSSLHRGLKELRRRLS